METRDFTTGELLPLSLDRESYIPYYRQIADQLRELIHTKRLSPGEPIWSEGKLAQQFGVSKMTVRQALQNLRQEGLLVVEKGKRPRIGAGRAKKNFQELKGFTEEMARRGMRASSKLLAIEKAEPGARVQEALRLNLGEKIYRIRRLRLADGELMGLETSHLPVALFPELDKQDLQNQSLYFLLENVYGVRLERSVEELEAISAHGEEAKLLDIARGSPLFSIRRTVYSAGDDPVEYGLSLFRGDRYTATVISHRKP